jgi:hypothetical protein
MDSSTSTGRILDTWGRSRDPSIRGPPGGIGNQRQNTMGGIGSVFVYLARSGGVSVWPFISWCSSLRSRTDGVCRRFPVISGFRVSWDSRRSPGQRVLGVWLQEEQADDASTMSTDSGFSTPALKDGEAISRDHSEPIFKILTREYMAQGHDGFTPLKGNNYLIDDESGQITSTVVRKYLLGSSLVDSAYKTRILTGCVRITICKEAGPFRQVPRSSTRRNP